MMPRKSLLKSLAKSYGHKNQDIKVVLITVAALIVLAAFLVISFYSMMKNVYP